MQATKNFRESPHRWPNTAMNVKPEKLTSTWNAQPTLRLMPEDFTEKISAAVPRFETIACPVLATNVL
jgi:hypothetical protein